MKPSRISSDPTHNWSRQSGGWWKCVNPGGCGARQWSPDGEPDASFACDGLQKTELENGSGPPPVADGGRKRRTDPETGVRHTYGPCFEWISQNLPCCVCGKTDGAPADHWKTVGSGGKDPGNCLPICADHSGRHDMGRETWATAHRIDPVETAMEAWRAFERAEPELAEKLESHLPEGVVPCE